MSFLTGTCPFKTNHNNIHKKQVFKGEYPDSKQLPNCLFLEEII
jgi:hypothetical protein